MRRIIILSLTVTLGIAALSQYSSFLSSPPPSIAHQNPYKPLYRYPTDERIVALSFDDGPDPRYTLPIIKTLNDRGVKATFFVVGSQAEKHPDIISDMVRHGHEIGNHTWSHPEMDIIQLNALISEVKDTNELISQHTGQQITYFRPPKGVLTSDAREELGRMGFITVLWAIGIENSSAKTPEQMAQRVLNRIKPGDIILLHDGRLDRSTTVKALPLLLDGLTQKGYRAVTVGDLLNYAGNMRIQATRHPADATIPRPAQL